MTVVGEPGIGKSRLIGDFADHVEELPDLVRWRQGRCLPYGEGVSFWALSEAVKAEAGIMDDDDPVEARAALDAAIDAAVPDEQERGWLRPRLAALLGLGEGDDDAPREERFQAWARYLEALAQGGPFVLVIEDLHWADDAMLEFIEYLARQDRDSPMFILCADAARAARSTSRLGNIGARLHHDPAASAVGGRDRQLDRGAAGTRRAARRDPGQPDRTERWQPPVRRGIRADADRPRHARRGRHAG